MSLNLITHEDHFDEQINKNLLAKWYSWALFLAGITVFYNLLEGVISVWFGFNDETLALFGFGLDSFIEVLSGVGVLHMVLRLQHSPNTQERDRFETLALRITGTSFYLLIAGTALLILIHLFQSHKPDTTFWGIVISALSILTMYSLMRAKLCIAEKLNSSPIRADANCTRACLYLSFLLLASSLTYQWTGFAYADSIGALGIMWFAYQEGQEAFALAANKQNVCCSKSCH
ncbi:MAG: cation transporter [Candidatus Sericytochromatia bacterium]|jgi:divalent metal cation (Fe/Co/Zn/Cd) transporter